MRYRLHHQNDYTEAHGRSRNAFRGPAAPGEASDSAPESLRVLNAELKAKWYVLTRREAIDKAQLRPPFSIGNQLDAIKLMCQS